MRALPFPAPLPDPRAGALLALRVLLLALGLLHPISLPYSVPRLDDGPVLGWSTRPLHDEPDAPLAVSQTTRISRDAGLMPGDVVLAVDGLPATPERVLAARRAAEPGEVVELRVRRDGATHDVRVPVIRGSVGNAGYLALVLGVVVLGWLVGMALVAARGDDPAALLLGAVLLLLGPAVFPSGVAGEGVLREGARLGWQMQMMGYRLFFPLLLLHFFALSTPRPEWLRSGALWSCLYALQLGVLASVTRLGADPLAASARGAEWRLTVGAAFVAEVLALLGALLLYPHRAALPATVRWLGFAALVLLTSSVARSLAVLGFADASANDVFYRLNGLTLILLPVAAGFFLLQGEGGAAGAWRDPRRMGTWISAALTGLYALAVAGTAAVVLGRADHGLAGMEWVLFAAIAAAVVVFSPILRWTREMIDRRLVLRWTELETRVHALVDRLGAQLEVERIAACIAEELPAILGASAAELVLAAELAQEWGLKPWGWLRSAPRAELERRTSAPPGGAEAWLPVSASDGSLLAALRLRRPVDGELDEAGRTALRTLCQGIAAALRNAGTYLTLRHTQEGLAEAERIASLGALAGGLAHEIKNPLAGLKMGLYLLEKEGADPARLRRIQWDVQRIDHLVSRLFRFTTTELQEEPEPVELQQLVRECVRDVQPRLQDRGVDLRERYAAHPLVTLARRSQLRLIVSNLLSNALDAVGEGGSIAVTIRGDDDLAEIQVWDDGPGIPSEVRERIFDLDFSTKPGGSGFGLAIARRETERLGGRIVVDPTSEVGTRLSVTFPRVI